MDLQLPKRFMEGRPEMDEEAREASCLWRRHVFLGVGSARWTYDDRALGLSWMVLYASEVRRVHCRIDVVLCAVSFSRRLIVLLAAWAFLSALHRRRARKFL